MARRKGFVYDQRAIDTIVALSGFQLGDEIVMAPDPAEDTKEDRKYHGKVVVVDKLICPGRFKHDRPWVVGVGDPHDPDFSTWLTRKNIKAWRRPI